MLTQLSRLALTDGTNTVNLININEGVDGAARFGYSVEDTELIIDNGATKYLTLEHQIDIRTLWDSSHKAQLSTWEQAKTPLQLSGYGVDGFVYWHDPVIVGYADTPAGSSQVFWIKATRTTPPGYDSAFRKTGGIQAGKNLLSIFDREQGSSTLMAGIDAVGSGLTNSFNTANGQQTITVDTEAALRTLSFSPGGSVSSYLFPYPGNQVTLSIDVVSFTANFSIGISFRNQADSQISSIAMTITGTGITTHTVTLPAGTFYIRPRVRVEADAQAGNELVFRRPSLNIGTTRNYSRF